MTKPNKLQLTHDEIELTNNDIQDMLLDMGFNEYRATQDFFSSLAECGQKFGNVVSEAAIKELMIASMANSCWSFQPKSWR